MTSSRCLLWCLLAAQARVKFGQDRARRHEIRAARAKVSAEALAARKKMGMDLLRAKEAAIKARQGSAVANNPAAADAAAVAAAIGTCTCGHVHGRRHFAHPRPCQHQLLCNPPDVLGPGSAQRVERLHMRGALGNANRRRRSTLSAIPPCVSRRLSCVRCLPAGAMTLVGCVALGTTTTE